MGCNGSNDVSNSEDNHLTEQEEEFLSSHKMQVITTTDISACFQTISIEFKHKFDKYIDSETLYAYYSNVLGELHYWN